MKRKRLQKVNEEIRRILSDVLLFDMKDPRINGIVSITHVDTAADLKSAKVYVSCLNGELQEDELIEILRRAKGYFRRRLGEKLELYHTPEVLFYYDDSIAKAMEMDELFKKLNP
ncbi:MAG: 30S ribosome-binding factor RbfA [Tissierellia bacterium]|jgi:ribosome-binding factor A|nr:30S ribosome-binding factor RbfA [Bacillota bacterium]NLL22193.1 30S ribosome-binding factor RbfA [Tissierellia bacterium]